MSTFAIHDTTFNNRNMKKVLFSLLAMMPVAAMAQFGGFGGGFGGFGGPQAQPQIECSEKFTDINYAGDDNVYHTLDIYLPKEVKDSYPVVIHIYGSAWFSNNSKGAADIGTICKALLDAGYAVVTPNHRSSGDAKFPAQINDIKAVVRFVRGEAAKYKFDTSFIATSGFSSGAHLASLAATSGGVKELEGELGAYTSQSSSVDAASEWSGPIDLMNMDCGDAMMMNPSPEETLMGFNKAGNEDKFATLSPIHYIDKNDPPIIIFHGKNDNVVPSCQAPEFYDTLQKAGVKSEITLVEGGGHGMNMYSEENLAKMVKFLNDAKAAKAAK